MTIQTATLTPKTINRVRELNDEFRRDIFNRELGTIRLTAGVVAINNDDDIFELASEVQCFEEFEDNAKEHECGYLDFRNQEYFFTIGYYEKGTRNPAADKTNKTTTRRVLTIMHTSEQR